MSDYKFMTLQEVAAILQLDPMTIYRYIKKGSLVAHKFGKSYRITQDNFIKFLESARQEAVEANKEHRSCITPQRKKAVKSSKAAKVAKTSKQSKKTAKKAIKPSTKKSKK